ncbi:putative hyoscyamine (6S)-dioxygenase [Rosa chinensis]|uniref:Putative hyoscyamine (6S)-dioxygenase n=1 Tax=Rosa chinensis TaxID=74649 RepID=A0A2P6P4I8_ROSCH|nr:putative hyoscyamine (6S)-dioxygenase [Rosa chinensis]
MLSNYRVTRYTICNYSNLYLCYFREHVSKCFIDVKEVALNILKLTGEGLGIGSEYFSDELSKETDVFLITILHQGDVSGLQVFKDGERIGLEPTSNGLVVNIGYQLRIISNGKLKCDEHQVVTNSSTVWTTFGFFITPSPDCCIEPAAALINASNPRLYKGFRYEEFPANYFRKQGKTEVVLEPFEIEC